MAGSFNGLPVPDRDPSATIGGNGDLPGTAPGVVGDGVTDTSTALQAVINRRKARGGGEIILGAGTYVVKNIVIPSNVRIIGAGTGATILKLADGANTDLIVTEDFASLTGGTTQAGPSKFGLRDLTLDGNRANNTSGWPLRIYGSSYRIENVHIKNGKSGGAWTQWGIGGTDMESHWANFKIFNCQGVVLDHNGPHDSIFVNGSVFNDSTMAGETGTLCYVRGQSSGSQFTNVHFWGVCSRVVDVINGTFFANCQAEGGTISNVRFQSNFSQWVGGHIFGTTSGTEIGVELGVGGGTSAKGNLFSNVMLSRFGATSTPVSYVNSAGGNIITGQIGVSVTSPGSWSGSTKQSSDVIYVLCSYATVPQQRFGQTRTGIYLPGTSGNYITAPDANALDVNDIDIAWFGSFADWNTLAAAMVDKFGAAGQRSWELRMSATQAGRPELTCSQDGTAAETRIATAVVPFSAWQLGWVRVTKNATTGVVTFYTAPDGGLFWTQLGNTVAGTIGATFVGTRAVELGSDAGGTAHLAEGIHVRAVIKSGIDGAVVADFQPSSEATRYRDSAGATANVWTVNGSATALVAA